jgi:hypothetical protein
MKNTELTQTQPAPQAVKPALDARADYSLYDFAKRHGYVYRTVCITVQRWGRRTDRQPHGGLARQIMAELKIELFQTEEESDHA